MPSGTPNMKTSWYKVYECRCQDCDYARRIDSRQGIPPALLGTTALHHARAHQHNMVVMRIEVKTLHGRPGSRVKKGWRSRPDAKGLTQTSKERF